MYKFYDICKLHINNKRYLTFDPNIKFGWCFFRKFDPKFEFGTFFRKNELDLLKIINIIYYKRPFCFFDKKYPYTLIIYYKNKDFDTLNSFLDLKSENLFNVENYSEKSAITIRHQSLDACEAHKNAILRERNKLVDCKNSLYIKM